MSATVTVSIPALLRPLVQQQKEVEAQGQTVGQVFVNLEKQYPGLYARLVQNQTAEAPAMHRFINVFVNDNDIRFCQGLDTPVATGDTITILPAVAGGASQPLLSGWTLICEYPEPSPSSKENNTDEHSALLQALGYQAKALGLSWQPVAKTQEHAQKQAQGQNPNSQAVQLSLQPSLRPIGPQGGLHQPPALATCTVQAWPQSGASATEFIMQAASGMMAVHGRSSGGWHGLGLDVVAVLSACMALQGLLALGWAKLNNPNQDQGHFELSQLHAAVLALGQYIAGASVAEDTEHIAVGASPAGSRPPFVSADGVVFELETLNPEPWRAFWTALGVDAQTAGQAWGHFLLRYAKAMAPLPAALHQATRQHSHAQLAALAHQTGMCLCPVRSLAERAQDADTTALLCQGPWHFVEAQAQVQAQKQTPSPCPITTPETSPEAAMRGPLHGVQVVESCRRIQGPMAGHVLAMLGASVLRLEPPGGDPLRMMPPLATAVDSAPEQAASEQTAQTVSDRMVSARFDALNHLKTVQEVDLKSAQGQAQVRALVGQADVFLHNWAPGKAESLGLDAHTLHGVQGHLVYAHASDWGQAPGPGSAQSMGLLGTDFMAQAYSGLAQHIGAQANMPGGTLFTMLDVLGGMVAAQGVVAALFAQKAQGRAGIVVETSLLGAATTLSAPVLSTTMLSDPVWSTPTLPTFKSNEQSQKQSQGQTCKPYKPWVQGVYPCASGHLAIDCQHGQQQAELLRILEIDTASAMATALQRHSASTWCARLQAVGVPCCPVPSTVLEATLKPSNPGILTNPNADYFFYQTDLASMLTASPAGYTRVLPPWRFA